MTIRPAAVFLALVALLLSGCMEGCSSLKEQLEDAQRMVALAQQGQRNAEQALRVAEAGTTKLKEEVDSVQRALEVSHQDNQGFKAENAGLKVENASLRAEKGTLLERLESRGENVKAMYR